MNCIFSVNQLILTKHIPYFISNPCHSAVGRQNHHPYSLGFKKKKNLIFPILKKFENRTLIKNYRTKQQQSPILLIVPPEIHRNYGATSKIQKTQLPCDPAIPSMSIDLKEVNWPVWHRNICTFMLFIALVTKNGTKTRCPSTDKWINKINIHTEHGVLFNHKEK